MGLQYMYGPNTTWEGFELMGFQAAIFRSGSRGALPIMAWITPSDETNLRLKTTSALCQGAKHFFYGPTARRPPAPRITGPISTAPLRWRGLRDAAAGRHRGGLAAGQPRQYADRLVVQHFVRLVATAGLCPHAGTAGTVPVPGPRPVPRGFA